MTTSVFRTMTRLPIRVFLLTYGVFFLFLFMVFPNPSTLVASPYPYDFLFARDRSLSVSNYTQIIINIYRIHMKPTTETIAHLEQRIEELKKESKRLGNTVSFRTKEEIAFSLSVRLQIDATVDELEQLLKWIKE
jgi:hypothetical protein